MMFRVSPDGDVYPDPDSPRKVESPNAVRCLSCFQTIVSTHRHDYVTCSCGNVSVDGGNDYSKRSWKPEKSPAQSWTEITTWPIREEWL